jgi:hypothetical protein
MKIEDQVCSLELAKRLKELGVKQESYFYWFVLVGIGTARLRNNEWRPEVSGEEPISAFTVSELMEMLPAYIDTKKNEPFNTFYFDLRKRTAKNIQYIVNYYCDTVDQTVNIVPYQLLSKNIYDEKLADCLAKTLIYLTGEGLINVV